MLSVSNSWSRAGPWSKEGNEIIEADKVNLCLDISD